MLKITLLQLLGIALCLLPAITNAREEAGAERIRVFRQSGFVPATSTASWNMGQTLCGTRCNALATDYLDVTEPGGWGLVQVARNRELIVDLDNPFLMGKCICIVDEYEARKSSRTNRNIPVKPAPPVPASKEGERR